MEMDAINPAETLARLYDAAMRLLCNAHMPCHAPTRVSDAQTRVMIPILVLVFFFVELKNESD